MSEDNPLANVNLRVVTALRSPAGFADGVLARFASTEAAIAAEKRRRLRRRAWVASAALAAAAAVLAGIWLWPHAMETGSYASVQPQHLDVAGLGVDLEGGAAIAWTVKPDGLHVEQRGAATWTVPPGRQLRVEVAGIGTVDASHATLHVEAQMNVLEKKTIGVTAATAALVTAVAVTVIHGQATVTGAGQALTIKDGESAAVAPGKAPVEVLTSGQATAVEIVFSGEQRWTDQQLETMESAIDHVQLPLGSTVGAVSYSTGAKLRAEATPTSRFGAGWLGYPPLYRGATGSDLIQGVTLGMAELAKSSLPRKVLVIIGDGNDSDHSEAAKLKLRDLEKKGTDAHVVTHAILVPPFTATPTLAEAAGIPTSDATKVELTHAFADAAGGQVETPRAVMIVYEGRGMWVTPDVLRTVAAGIADMDLPPDSRIGAIEYSTGASTRIPFEPAKSYKPEQLGSAGEYASKRGSDLIVGVAMGLAELAKAPESKKVLVVVGDGHDTNDAAALRAVDDLVAQAQRANVRIRAIQHGSIDTLPGALLKRLDPHVSWASGNGYRGRLIGLQMGLGLAGENARPFGGGGDER